LEEKLQSEKPREAKKAEENKLFAKPVPAQGEYQAVARKEDQAVAAKLGSEPVDGVGSGAYSQFLHDWAMNITQVYQPVGIEDGCTPTFDVEFQDGHVNDVEPMSDCNPAAERAFRAAIKSAHIPPPPIGFLNYDMHFMFYNVGKQ
jgi:hypothetical protein